MSTFKISEQVTKHTNEGILCKGFILCKFMILEELIKISCVNFYLNKSDAIHNIQLLNAENIRVLEFL